MGSDGDHWPGFWLSVKHGRLLVDEGSVYRYSKPGCIDGSQNLAYKRMGPENHLDPNLFLICGCESWVDFFVKLGPSSPRLNGSNCLKT